MSEADQLKEDIQRMLQGLPRRGTEPIEENNEDFDDTISEAKSEVAEVVRDVIRQTITKESIKKICEEKGLMQRIGQVGIGRISEELKSELVDTIENNFPEDR